MTDAYEDIVEELTITAGRAMQKGDDTASVNASGMFLVLSHNRVLVADRIAVLAIHVNNGKGYCIECRNSYRWPCPTLRALGVHE
jgi:hypothetical protein